MTPPQKTAVATAAAGLAIAGGAWLYSPTPRTLSSLQAVPPSHSLTLAWDTYTNPAATQLTVQGADDPRGPWTNEAIITPPATQSSITLTNNNPQHFYRVAVTPQPTQ